MITALISSGNEAWAGRVRSVLADGGTVLDVDPRELAAAVPASVSVDLACFEIQHLTDRATALVALFRSLHPESRVVCLAPEEVVQRARAEGALDPDFWVIMPAGDLQLATQVEAVVAAVAAGRNAPLGVPGLAAALERGTAAAVISDTSHGSVPESVLYRTIGRMTGSWDLAQLLGAYCDAVHELAQCVSYCLLWQAPGADRFALARSQGLPPVVEEVFRPGPDDPLPTWLQRHRGIITRDALVLAPEGAGALRQLELCGGVLAFPLFSQAVLRGFMVVGPKAIGSPYLASEAETLFMLSANAAAAARQVELHRELENRNNYIDQVLSAMESGVLTADLDGRLCVCNPYASRVLRLPAGPVTGRSLRELPAPLGDYLYAGLRHGEERTREEVVVFGGQVFLRVSTRCLGTPPDAPIGSVLLLEDVTAERALAEERRKVERSDIISQVMARFAHEIKNPLATIHTFAELLPERAQDPEFRQFWSDHVKRDVTRLDDLVAKLVSLSEPPAAHLEAVEIADLLRLATERVAALDDTGAACVEARVARGLPTVRVDTDVMVPAIAHLLRYGQGPDHQNVTVEAQLESASAGRQAVTILVRAHHGTPRGDPPHQLLDPSYVLDHPEIDLGPSASQRLIESQGGGLTADVEDDDIVFRIALAPAAGTDTAALAKE